MADKAINNWNDEEKWQFLVRHERLGELLLKSGKISIQQLEGLLQQQSETGKHLGEMIVEQNLLSLDEIVNGLHLQEQSDYKSTEAINELKQRSQG